jgi:hypothetical protein
MSETVLYIIPEDPFFIPAHENREKALEICRNIKMPSGTNYEIYDECSDKPIFYDCGDGFEHIRCPLCASEIDTDFWGETFNKAYENNFMDLSIKAPCCKQTISLNDVKFEPPMGLAQYAIVFGNIEYYPEKIDVKKLERILNCKLRLVWAHY